MAAKLIARGKDIGFTILPYELDTSIQKELTANPSDRVLGYVTRNEETGVDTFTYTESGGLTEAGDHWSLAILKEFPYNEQKGPWIVYRGVPEKAARAFGKILGNYAQSLHIYNWDIWAVAGKEGNVAVVTSWETY